MTKSFFQGFPTLKLDSMIASFFEQVTVERITSTKRKDYLRIYLSSEHLIQKDMIFKVEQEIKKQLFPLAEMVIRIFERYRLSSQYNPEKLMELYKDSILLELKEYSHVEYSMFKGAELSFPEENRLLLLLKMHLKRQPLPQSKILLKKMQLFSRTMKL